MSWDIVIQDFPRDIQLVEEIPEDFQPKSLGRRDDLIQAIKGAIPHVDFTDPAWGIVHNETWSIEVNMGDDEVCDSIMLHVRGGEEAVDAVATILNALNLRAIDCQTSEFFSAGRESSESFAKWREFRDQVMDEHSNRD